MSTSTHFVLVGRTFTFLSLQWSCFACVCSSNFVFLIQYITSNYNPGNVVTASRVFPDLPLLVFSRPFRRAGN